MPFVSVILLCTRPGDLDELFDSLAAQTFTDFEFVLVDTHHAERQEAVRRAVWERFLDVRHVGVTPVPPSPARGALLNVGIITACGDVSLFMTEGVALPPELVGRHAAFHLADPSDHAAMIGAVDFAHPRGRVPASKITLANTSVLRARLVEVGGIDEAFDIGLARHQDAELAERLTTRAGVAWMSDPAVNASSLPGRGEIYQGLDGSRSGDLLAARRAEGFPELSSSRLVELKKLERVDLGRDIPDPPRRAAPSEPFMPIDVRSSGQIAQPLKVAMIYGEFSSAIHGPFDLSGLYERVGLTGSESSFFNLATSLSELGHEVAVFCDCEEPYKHPSGWEGIPIRALDALVTAEGLDAVIAWNEPDYLVHAPEGVRRYCDQQLNDFGYCRPGWQRRADVWISPSENHKTNVMQTLPTVVIPNSVDLDLFAGDAPVRNPHRVVWCSSPDRGLHHLLSMWPDVRARVPDAELHVFYRLRPWLERAIGSPDEVGKRARYIAEVLPRLGPFGVQVHDVVPNRRMAHELRQAACLAYPCDPVRYTEGFGCSVLDAAAGGCLPIISAADALPSVHGSAAIGIPGAPGQVRRAWVEAIVSALTHGPPAAGLAKMRQHAMTHNRHAIAQQWEKLIRRP